MPEPRNFVTIKDGFLVNTSEEKSIGWQSDEWHPGVRDLNYNNDVVQKLGRNKDILCWQEDWTSFAIDGTHAYDHTHARLKEVEHQLGL